MKKRSHAKKQKWRALQHGFQALDAIAMEIMQEVFARLRYGPEFTLSDGSVARLEKLSEPGLCGNEHSENYERPYFGVDVVIESGRLDRVGISAYQTGWGMVVDPAAVNQAPGSGTRREAATGGGEIRSPSSSESRPSRRKGRGSRGG